MKKILTLILVGLCLTLNSQIWFNNYVNSQTIVNSYRFVAESESGIPTDYVAYYPFNGDADDYSGNGNNGTVNGATLSTNRFGGSDSAYYFPSASSISVSNNSDLYFGTGDFSVCFWFKTTSTGNRWVLSLDNASSTIGHNYGIVSGKFRFNIRGTLGGSITSNNNISLNTYYHIVCIRQSGTMTMYVDNVLQTSTLTGKTESVTQSTSNYVIGNYTVGGNPSELLGNIDYIIMYDRALTSTEIGQIYNNLR